MATGRQAPSFAEKIKLWFAPPGYRPDWAGSTVRGVSPLTHGEAGKYDAVAPARLRAYILLQFLGAIGLTVLLLFAGGGLVMVERLAVAVLIAWTVTNLGGIFDRKPWLLLSELLRLVALWAFAVAATTGLTTEIRTVVAALGALAAGAFASWLLRYRSSFLAYQAE